MNRREDGIVVTHMREMTTADHGHALYHVICRASDHSINFGTILRQELRPGQRSRGHEHQEAELYFVLEGTLVFITKEDEIMLPAGTAAFVPGGVPHAVRNPSETQPNVNLIIMEAGHKREDDIPVEL